MEDQPTDRVVFGAVLEPELGIEGLRQLVDVGPAVDPDFVRGQPDQHRLLDVVLVLDLADDLLEQVLDRHETRRATVLVEHDRDVDLAPLELVQQVVDRHRLGHEYRRPQQRSECRARLRSVLQDRQQVFRVQDADDLVDRLLEDRDPRVALLDHDTDRLVQGRRCGQGDDRDARGHHLVQAPVAQLDDRVDHLLLLGLQHALLPAPLHDQHQLLGADLCLGPDLCAEHPGDGGGDPREEGDERGEDPRQEIDRTGQRHREALGMREGERLGHELAEDDREQSEDDRDNQERDPVGRVGPDAQARQEGGEIPGQRHCSER